MKQIQSRVLLLTLSLTFLSITLFSYEKKPFVALALENADPVLVGAGDIASCSESGDEATALLLDDIAGTVFTLGDNVYESGTASQFIDCYQPSWGRHKVRTKPAPGNHDYATSGAAGYYGYFGGAASPLDNSCTSNCKGYYSYDLGTWHIIVINSEISMSTGSAQEKWLRSELATHSNVCTLAYWHKPRFSSGMHGNDTSSQALWQALYDHGADVVINGHDHNYERFALQNPSGQADTTRGIREFVVGTGGKGIRSLSTIQPNSQVRSSTAGVLKLTLHASSYDWEFVPIAGQTFRDSGSDACIGSIATTPTLPPTPTLSPPPSTPTPTLPPPTGSDKIFVSSSSSGSVGGISFADEDVLVYNASTNGWSMYLDGSDVMTTSLDIDGFARLADGSLLFGFNTPGIVIPLGTVDDSDILKFTPSSLGSTTSGTFSWYFDGSDVGLTTDDEDVDDFTVLSDGRLVLGTIGLVDVPGAVGMDEDLLAFTPTQLGATTTGTWALYFDGSDVALLDTVEDIRGTWIDLANGDLYLATFGLFAVTGLTGDSADIFVCDSGLLGTNTTCIFHLYWDGSAHGFAKESIDGFDLQLETQPGSNAIESTISAIDHQAEGDDPWANPNELSDDVIDREQQYQIFLPNIQ